jgi:hypothetical protein
MVDAEFEDRDPPRVFEETDALSSARTADQSSGPQHRTTRRNDARSGGQQAHIGTYANGAWTYWTGRWISASGAVTWVTTGPGLAGAPSDK